MTLVMLLSPILILYGLMRPRDPGFTYKFLEGRKPIQVGFFQDMGGGHDGSEFAVYSWQGNYADSVLAAKNELKGATFRNRGKDYVEFLFKDGLGVGLMATKLTTGQLTYSDKLDVPDQNSVTVISQRRLPPGLFSELRIGLFRTRF